MSWEDALKTPPKRRERAPTVSTSAGRRGKLEPLQEILLQAFTMVPAPPQGTTCMCMGAGMDQIIRIPSTSWTWIHWSGPSYPVDP